MHAELVIKFVANTIYQGGRESFLLLTCQHHCQSEAGFFPGLSLLLSVSLTFNDSSSRPNALENQLAVCALLRKAFDCVVIFFSFGNIFPPVFKSPLFLKTFNVLLQLAVSFFQIF